MIREKGRQPTAMPATGAMSSMAWMVTLQACLDLTKEKAEEASFSGKTGEPERLAVVYLTGDFISHKLCDS